MTALNTTTRPIYWHGVDAQDMPGGVCEIDWDFLAEVKADCDGDRFVACEVLNAVAGDCYQAGDLDDCAWFACHGMVALNYLELA